MVDFASALTSARRRARASGRPLTSQETSGIAKSFAEQGTEVASRKLALAESRETRRIQRKVAKRATKEQESQATATTALTGAGTGGTLAYLAGGGVPGAGAAGASGAGAAAGGAAGGAGSIVAPTVSGAAGTAGGGAAAAGLGAGAGAAGAGAGAAGAGAATAGTIAAGTTAATTGGAAAGGAAAAGVGSSAATGATAGAALGPAGIAIGAGIGLTIGLVAKNNCIIVTACTSEDSYEVNVTREYRDMYLNPAQILGYYWLASILVPWINKFSLLRRAVKFLLVDRLIDHGEVELGYKEKHERRFSEFISVKFLNLCYFLGFLKDELYKREVKANDC